MLGVLRVIAIVTLLLLVCVVSANNGLERQLALNSSAADDKPSPSDWIGEKQVIVRDDAVVIRVSGASWARFSDTKSMDPVFDSAANAIEIKPKSAGDIHVGDIVTYKPQGFDGIVIHRVVDIGSDGAGWFAVLKGDNNKDSDLGRVRFGQVESVVVAIIY